MVTRRLAWFFAVLLGICISITTNAAQAASVSELFLGSDTPRAVELSGLTGHSTVELVMLDASMDGYGNVIQIIQIDVTDSLHLLSDGDWSGSLWEDNVAALPAGRALGLDDVTSIDGATDRLDITGERSIHLYDRPTNMQLGVSLHDGFQQFILDFSGANLLDAVTLAPGGEAWWHTRDEPVIDTDLGSILTRQTDPLTGLPSEDWLAGWTNEQGYLTHENTIFKVTPGHTNPSTWKQVTPVADDVEVVAAPTPSAAAMLAVGLVLLAVHRLRRRTHHGSTA